VSARKGEFECSFERGGFIEGITNPITYFRTRRVKKIIFVVSKLDDPSIECPETRFEFK
jgi:translation elongation factor EF-1alpha